MANLELLIQIDGLLIEGAKVDAVAFLAPLGIPLQHQVFEVALILDQTVSKLLFTVNGHFLVLLWLAGRSRHD